MIQPIPAGWLSAPDATIPPAYRIVCYRQRYAGKRDHKCPNIFVHDMQHNRIYRRIAPIVVLPDGLENLLSKAPHELMESVRIGHIGINKSKGQVIVEKDQEIADLRQHITELMAIIDYYGGLPT